VDEAAPASPGRAALPRARWLPAPRRWPPPAPTERDRAPKGRAGSPFHAPASRPRSHLQAARDPDQFASEPARILDHHLSALALTLASVVPKSAAICLYERSRRRCGHDSRCRGVRVS